MYSLDVLRVCTEVGGVVDFVLEEDTGDFVWCESRRFICIYAAIKEIILQRSRRDGELEVPSCFHIRISDSMAPEFDCLSGHCIFGGGFFVFAVEGLEEAVSPEYC